jgi:hypothetical protein
MYFDWGKNLSHKKMSYSYRKEMFTGRANPIWIIGGPDNQRPEKRNSTVYAALTLYVWSDVRLCSPSRIPVMLLTWRRDHQAWEHVLCDSPILQ